MNRDRRQFFEQVIKINSSLISCSILDDDRRARLESCLARPFHTWGGELQYKTVPEQAAVLLQGIALNHPFIDGNKRTAWLTCQLFLEIHGFSVRHDVDEQAGPMVEKVVKRIVSLEELTYWLISVIE